MSWTPREIAELMRVAKAEGASSFSYQGLEVKFDPTQPAKIQTRAPIISPPKVSYPERPQIISSGPRPNGNQERAIQRGEPGWHAWRRKGVGGSDAPAIMNMVPWSNPQKVWEEKTGRRQADPANFPMRRGLRLEPIARYRYQDMTGLAMPADAGVHAKLEFVRANADGVNWKEGIALEIKCPGKKDHAVALGGEIPEKYKFQLVHLLAVLGLERIDYFSFDGEDGVIVPFDRNKALESKLLSEETRFWEHVTTDNPPPRPGSPSPGKGKVTIFPIRKSRG